ncbi:MAG: RpiB/LacA/LacB family sugar-phosphate isomerase [Chitinophagales bacterium]|jgi:ribose 5-phosphate isomerase B|nr:RpiB/LacA/LacB family sugar-phosphate isomerase [Chitinophagales bacterium]
MIPIPIASDHAGFDLKETLKSHFSSYQWIDFGTNNTNSMDYPDVVHPLCKSLMPEGQLGILICGSANGVAMTANKYAHVRAAICWQMEIAALARQHNNANILCLPARFISSDLAIDIVEIFMNTSFEGGRHACRVDKISI